MNLPITEQTFSSSKPIDELGIKEAIDLIKPTLIRDAKEH